MGACSRNRVNLARCPARLENGRVLTQPGSRKVYCVERDDPMPHDTSAISLFVEGSSTTSIRKTRQPAVLILRTFWTYPFEYPSHGSRGARCRCDRARPASKRSDRGGRTGDSIRLPRQCLECASAGDPPPGGLVVGIAICHHQRPLVFGAYIPADPAVCDSIDFETGGSSAACRSGRLDQRAFRYSRQGVQ
jgi:hypothetical protein